MFDALKSLFHGLVLALLVLVIGIPLEFTWMSLIVLASFLFVLSSMDGKLAFIANFIPGLVLLAVISVFFPIGKLLILALLFVSAFTSLS